MKRRANVPLVPPVPPPLLLLLLSFPSPVPSSFAFASASASSSAFASAAAAAAAFAGPPPPRRRGGAAVGPPSPSSSGPPSSPLVRSASSDPNDFVDPSPPVVRSDDYDDCDDYGDYDDCAAAAGAGGAVDRRAALSAFAAFAVASSSSSSSFVLPSAAAVGPVGPAPAPAVPARQQPLWTSKRPPPPTPPPGGVVDGLCDEYDICAVYTDAFVNLLTRYLLTYDEALRSWWKSQADLVVPVAAAVPGTLPFPLAPPPPPPAERDRDTAEEEARRRAAQFRGLEASVRAALASRGGRFEGKAGAAELFEALLRSYGDKGPSATNELCGIFAVLSGEYQPTSSIAAAQVERSRRLRELESPGGPDGTETDAVAPAPAPAAAVDNDLEEPGAPVFLPSDRRLVELPPGLRPSRPDGSDDGTPFELVTDGKKAFRLSDLAGLLRSRGGGDGGAEGKGPPPPLPVSRERTLGVSTYARFFAAGAIASGSAHAALTPLDMLKTRMQTQPERYGTGGPMKAAKLIYDEEGVGAFASGLGATAAGYFLGGSVAFGGTEFLKRLAVDVLGPRVALNSPFLLVLVCGGLAVAVCDLLVVPFEAARIRMVDDPDFAPSLPEALARLVREGGGLAGPYKGLPALLVKDVPFHATKFAVFDLVSTALKSSPFAVALLPGAALTLVAGAAAGVAAAVVSQPADATFTRCNRPQDGRGGRLSPVAAFRAVLEEGGIGAGLSSRCLFGAALVSLQFLFYSAAKSSLQITAGDLSLFLDAFSGLSLDP